MQNNKKDIDAFRNEEYLREEISLFRENSPPIAESLIFVENREKLRRGESLISRVWKNGE